MTLSLAAAFAALAIFCLLIGAALGCISMAWLVASTERDVFDRTFQEALDELALERCPVCSHCNKENSENAASNEERRPDDPDRVFREPAPAEPAPLLPGRSREREVAARIGYMGAFKWESGLRIRPFPAPGKLPPLPQEPPSPDLGSLQGG